MAKINGGYILLARKTLENSSWQALTEAGKIVMITLLMLANHKDRKWYNPLLKQEVMIKRGQCIIGRKSLAKQLRIGEQSVRTALTLLKSTNFLTIEPTSRFSIITICNYDLYQNPKNYTNQVNNQKDNQVLTKSQPSPNQVLTTLNELKNDKNDKNVKKDILSGKKPDLITPIEYLNQKTQSHFDPKNKSNQDLIKARYNEGRTLEQFKQIIDTKTTQWLNDPKMIIYLRPSTLFNRTNFENYLNEPRKQIRLEPKLELLPDSKEQAKVIAMIHETAQKFKVNK